MSVAPYWLLAAAKKKKKKDYFLEEILRLQTHKLGLRNELIIKGNKPIKNTCHYE